MKRWLNPEREMQIIELYEKYESAEPVAEIIGKSTETVYRALKKHSIKRTHRHDNKERNRTSPNCASRKLCPALVVMLHTCMKWSPKEISDFTDGKYKKVSVQSILSKRGLVNAKPLMKKSDFDLDQIEHEFLVLKISGRQLDKKYGLSEGTVCKWMRQRGHYSGKGTHQKGSLKPELAERHKQAEEEFAKRLIDEFDGKFEYVGNFRANGKKFATIRCTECGCEFEHYIGFQNVVWDCPECKQRQLEANRKRREEESEQEREARRYERMFEEMREYALDKTCKECGSTFHSVSTTALYCSDRCRRRVRDKNRRRQPNNFRHYYHVKYGERYRDHYDPSITLKKLYERDGGVCQICGEPCDWDDMEWGYHGPTYPSLDHIVPRAKGGDHKWENVQLAHCICNSRKRDLMCNELQEVMPIGA